MHWAGRNSQHHRMVQLHGGRGGFVAAWLEQLLVVLHHHRPWHHLLCALLPGMLMHVHRSSSFSETWLANNKQTKNEPSKQHTEEDKMEQRPKKESEDRRYEIFRFVRHGISDYNPIHTHLKQLKHTHTHSLSLSPPTQTPTLCKQANTLLRPCLTLRHQHHRVPFRQTGKQESLWRPSPLAFAESQSSSMILVKHPLFAVPSNILNNA